MLSKISFVFILITLVKEELVYWWEDVSEWWNKTIIPGFDEFVGLFGDGQFSDAMSLWKDDIENNLITLANDEDKLMQPIVNKFNEFNGSLVLKNTSYELEKILNKENASSIIYGKTSSHSVVVDKPNKFIKDSYYL